MRKTSFVIIAVVASILFSCNSASSDQTSAAQDSAVPKSATVVRIATQPSPFATAIFVAKEKGYLDEELKKLNVTAAYSSFASGPEMNESFAAGQQDIGIIGDLPAILSKASGQKTLIFAKAASGEKTLALVVKADSKIKTAKELKSKKIAYVKGSYAHHLLGLILDGAGLTFADIESINLPVADISAAVGQGQVDAGVLWEPGLSKGVNNKLTRVLIDGTDIKSNNIFYIVTEQFAKDNSAIVEAYVRALDRANEYIKSDPVGAAEAIQNNIKLPVTELPLVFPKFNYSPVIADRDIEELKVVEIFADKQGLSKSRFEIDQFAVRNFISNSGIVK